jgi:hypothetical protein
VPNANLIQLGGGFDCGIADVWSNESKYIFEIHVAHLTAWNLSIRQMHHEQSIVTVAEFGKQEVNAAARS